MLLEIACFSFESAVIAEQSGADRIELCENYAEGGITPHYDLIRKVKAKLKIPVHVIIRPRGGDFIYSPEEFEAMKSDVEECKKLKVEGVVFGILSKDFSIDEKRCSELLYLASPMKTTFHRAFDRVADPFASLESLISMGFDYLLTSGKEKTANDGVKLISELVNKANGKIIIMPGGNVRSENISYLFKTKANEFHSSALPGNNLAADENEIKKLKSIITEQQL